MEHLDKVKMILQNDFAVVPSGYNVYLSGGGAAVGVAPLIENDLGEYLQTGLFFPSTLIKQCKSYRGQRYP